MSRAYMAVAPIAAPEIPRSAHWWRLPLSITRPVGHDNFYTVEVDDSDNPKLATWTFNDGADEDITPLAIRGSTETDNCRFSGLVTDARYYLDVLSVERPTASDLWMELTPPGSRWHPDDGKIPHDEYAAELIRQSVLFREGAL